MLTKDSRVLRKTQRFPSGFALVSPIFSDLGKIDSPINAVLHFWLFPFQMIDSLHI